MFRTSLLVLSSALLGQAAYLSRHDDHGTSPSSLSAKASSKLTPTFKYDPILSSSLSSAGFVAFVTVTEYTTIYPSSTNAANQTRTPVQTSSTFGPPPMVFPDPGRMGSTRYPTLTVPGGLSFPVGTGTGKASGTAALPSISGINLQPNLPALRSTRAPSQGALTSASTLTSSPSSGAANRTSLSSKPAFASNAGFVWQPNLPGTKSSSSPATSTAIIVQTTSTPAVVVVPITPTNMALQARQTLGLLPHGEIPNTGFVQKGDNNLNDALNSMLEQARGPDTITLSTRRTTTQTPTSSSIAQASSSTPSSPKLSSRSASPLSAAATPLRTSVVQPHPKCPYPYPGVSHCGDPQTTLVRKVTSTTTSTKTKTIKTGKEKETQETNWCPYPGLEC